MSRLDPRISIFTVAVLLCLASLSVSALADSHVRIVRLSYIEGGVQISHRDARDFEKAMINLPIAEGMKLKTADDGRAEVEFEDGSTLRVTPNSFVEFPQLSLRDSGAKASAVALRKGIAYVDFAGTKNDEFTLQFGHESTKLTGAAHLRIEAGDKSASVAVFKGDIQIESATGAVQVKKNQTASFDLSGNDGLKLAKNIQEEPDDSWDKHADEYHTHYASKSSNSYSPYAYGTSDLAYYGNFFNAPGYGMMWQPYLVGAGWDPFMDGAWNFYPGWGYGWVSSYPWGWTPYHYGSWLFLPGYGWAWQPGGVWTTWYAQPVIVNAPKGYAPPKAPTSGTTTVAVNRGLSSALNGSKLVVRNNSAGLGLPRGQVENLRRLSQKVQEHGSVSQRIGTAPMEMGSAAGQRGHASESGMGNLSRGPQPTHSMSAPSSHASSVAAAGPHR